MSIPVALPTPITPSLPAAAAQDRPEQPLDLSTRKDESAPKRVRCSRWDAGRAGEKAGQIGLLAPKVATEVVLGTNTVITAKASILSALPPKKKLENLGLPEQTDDVRAFNAKFPPIPEVTRQSDAQTITVTKTHPLSNFFQRTFHLKGVSFAAGENLYQELKAFFCRDLHPDIYKALTSNRHLSPLDALRLGKPLDRLLNNNTRFWINAINILLRCSSQEEFQDELMKSGNSNIGHPVGNPFWGTDADGRGLNAYGTLLMLVRKCDHPFLSEDAMRLSRLFLSSLPDN